MRGSDPNSHGHPNRKPHANCHDDAGDFYANPIPNLDLHPEWTDNLDADSYRYANRIADTNQYPDLRRQSEAAHNHTTDQSATPQPHALHPTTDADRYACIPNDPAEYGSESAGAIGNLYSNLVRINFSRPIGPQVFKRVSLILWVISRLG
jgi:hypothetical protein